MGAPDLALSNLPQPAGGQVLLSGKGQPGKIGLHSPKMLRTVKPNAVNLVVVLVIVVLLWLQGAKSWAFANGKRNSDADAIGEKKSESGHVA
jgi:hypothetical protein